MKTAQEILVECWYDKIDAVWFMSLHHKKE
jgi:hypothetical protein